MSTGRQRGAPDDASALGALSPADLRLAIFAGSLAVASGVLHFVHSGNVVPFVVSAVALAALAALVGRSVDRLGDRLGSGTTGVVQAGLGNLPELFIAIFALRAGLVGVVQSALVGSILANLLAVLGVAFIAGGLRHGTQHFNADAPRMAAMLLLLGVSIVMIPTLSSHLAGTAAHHERALSDVASVVLLLVFVASIPFSLRPAPPGSSVPIEPGPLWPMPLVVVMLVVSSGTAALVSDWFIAALTPALGALHISQAFAGLVIVAIAGNAAENFVGISLAAKNRMDYALSAILQSPVQIALFVLPVLVLLSGPIGGPTLTLVLPLMLAVALGIGTIIAVVVVFDGESTWLEGAALVGLYVTVAASFWWR
ncbi:MAG: sodium:proton exchanger [Acidimicrobiaceae bacterium]|nr:sodium:proton exchanger [Acidimicrobiaceae bacterium]